MIDSKNVSDTFHRGPAAGADSNNCHLWKVIFHNLSSKSLTINIRCMPSHLGEEGKDLPEGVTWFDVDANDSADQFAGEAAQRGELPNAITWQPICYTKLIKSIQKRLATILLSLPHSAVEKKAPTASGKIITQWLQQSNH